MVMDISGLVSIVLQKLFFFTMSNRYSPVFQSDHTTSQSQGHWDRSGCNSQSKRRREACVGEASQPIER